MLCFIGWRAAFTERLYLKRCVIEKRFMERLYMKVLCFLWPAYACGIRPAGPVLSAAPIRLGAVVCKCTMTSEHDVAKSYAKLCEITSHYAKKIPFFA